MNTEDMDLTFGAVDKASSRSGSCTFLHCTCSLQNTTFTHDTIRFCIYARHVRCPSQVTGAEQI